MLLDLAALTSKYDLNITGVLHVGAHLAEEAPLYDALGIKNVWWIEANGDNIERVREIARAYEHRGVIQALITDHNDVPTMFHITNYDSMSSSVLEFGTHPTFSPDTVFVEHRMLKSQTLDRLHKANVFGGVNFLNMDLQGAEVLALKGASTLIPQLDYIYTEVNCKEVYKGCAQVEELDAMLPEFRRVETGWVADQGWGDALMIRRELT